MYEELNQRLSTVSAEAEWKASTDVTDLHTGERIGAERALAAFRGSRYVIENSRQLLGLKPSLSDLEFRELDKILLNAAESPATIPDVVRAKIETEARLSATLDGFTFCLDGRAGKCVQPITPNQIDEALVASRNLGERLRVWETSKQTGPALKKGLAEARDLRNRVATELGRELAQRYRQPVPEEIPAHWLPNRWGQEWPGLARSVDLDGLFRGKSPEWIVRQAERFYMSLGWPALPRSFWEKSDLYQLPPGSTRKKNTHASAWHIDYDQDVRSLMSVEPNFSWFGTSHHELGHIYYYLAYSNPRVPVVLRGGANRAFHEAIGDLIAIAARQQPYLREIGLLPAGSHIDSTQWLLSEALDNAVVFLPFSAGTMTHFEYDLYEKKLPADQFNQRWWALARRYQGIEPPTPRGEQYCDACTKTHIIDDPAQYYDYALAYLIKYQLHDYIARKILHQDPHNCNYYGNKAVGKWLWEMLSLGATRDWRQVIREKTGEDISSRALLEYFQPLKEYLSKENAAVQ